VFSKPPTLKDTIIIGATSLAILIINALSLKAPTVNRYTGMGLYYALLMYYRHYTLSKHEGKHETMEHADERSKSIAHEAAYRTFKLMLGFTFVAVWVPTTMEFPASALAIIVVGMSITIYTLLEIDLRLELVQKERSNL